ncbi:unnamed protein product [Rotaria sp. Silwood2]|nr:unnamed protein product [Rotaria sp. Silwood2]
MINTINQLFEHQNQNASTRLTISYLGFDKILIQLITYSNLFDFDQLLISTQIGSIEKISFSQTFQTDIIYLLSLCEHGDRPLRGICTNLLATLIQTTIHLLTLSSLSNSFNNSFINQCSLVSTNSQDSSRGIQLGILTELLSTFRLCLNDNNARIEFLEDSIQHGTSFYILAKVALAPLIDDIDFRILTYLEQQQHLKQHYPDIRVRQATASSFAKHSLD